MTLHTGYFTKRQLTNETVQNQTLQVITTRMTLHLWTKTSGIYCNYLSRPPSADRNDSPTSPWTHLFNTKMTIVTVNAQWVRESTLCIIAHGRSLYSAVLCFT